MKAKITIVDGLKGVKIGWPEGMAEQVFKRVGTGWNSPQPMILKTILTVGLFNYLIQLLMNLSRHFQSRIIEFIVLSVTALIVLGHGLQIGHHYLGEASFFGRIDQSILAFA